MKRCLFARGSGSALATLAQRSSFVSSSGLHRGFATATSTEELRGEARVPLKLTVGQQLHGYVVKAITPIPERNFTTYHLVHEKTGAQHFHIDTADTNNVFNVTFKTIPTDSTGVAHILEHTALCGSKKYPVRDPFFNMLKRSVNTYMNAYTAGDHTCYPFSTQNKKDYNNLLSVYLDASFFPLIQEADFRQEGHRLEFEKLDDPTSALKFKGVVYNEMKGAMSDSSSLFLQEMATALFPTLTYTHNSGGDPKNIPELTYEGLVNFHKRHYHPSNARFYTYGDMSLEEHLRIINEQALSKFDKISPNTDLPDEKRMPHERRVSATFPPIIGGDPNRQIKFSIAWLTLKIDEDPFENLAMNLLSKLLLDGPNAPMYAALIDSNIGLDYAPGTGFDPTAREAPFAIGLNGVAEKDLAKVEETIIATLQKAAQEGFSQERIESIIHQIEIGQKHITTNFGMAVSSGINYSWIHGANPAERLMVDKYIARLREELKAGPFFQNKIKKWFLDNPHRIILTMRPDEKYLDNLDTAEKEKLKKIRESLKPEEVAAIVKQARELKKRQEQEQDPSCLPTILLSDIPKESPGKETKMEQGHIALKNGMAPVPLLVVPQPTNGITYFRALASLHNLPEDLQPYVPLFAMAVTSMGAGAWDYRELAQQTESHTGGIGFSPSLVFHPEDVSKYNKNIFISSHCLDSKLDKMFEILERIFSEPKMEDLERLKSLISMRTSDLQDSLTHAGHSYAMAEAASVFSRAHEASNSWDGVPQVGFMQELAMKESADLEEVADKLRAIARHILDASLLRCHIIAQDQTLPVAQQRLERFLNQINSTGSSPSQYLDSGFKAPSEQRKKFVPLPASVNFVVKSLPSVNYTHPDSPKLKVLSSLLGSNYLHTEIREKGGAYGGGASSGGDGVFTFYSYRDPNLLETLNVYEGSVAWLEGTQSSPNAERLLEEAKMKIFSSLDHPVAPSGKGSSLFSKGVTYEMKQRYRDGIFATSWKDLKEVANTYLLQPQQHSSIAVLGNEKENPFGDNPQQPEEQ